MTAKNCKYVVGQKKVMDQGIQSAITFLFLNRISKPLHQINRLPMRQNYLLSSCVRSSAPVFQWCCSTPQGSPGVGRNTFLSSPHLCFIIVFICDLFVSRDDPLMS